MVGQATQATYIQPNEIAMLIVAMPTACWEGSWDVTIEGLPTTHAHTAFNVSDFYVCCITNLYLHLDGYSYLYYI